MVTLPEGDLPDPPPPQDRPAEAEQGPEEKLPVEEVTQDGHEVMGPGAVSG